MRKINLPATTASIFISAFLLCTQIAFANPAQSDQKLLEQAKAWAQKNDRGVVSNAKMKAAKSNTNAVSGTVVLSKSLQSQMPSSGVLFVYARQFGLKAGPPTAVIRIANPKFPQSFQLSSENVMMPGTPFSGPFTLTAKFSPAGDAMQKSGAYIGFSADKQKIELGQSDIDLQIDTAL